MGDAGFDRGDERGGDVRGAPRGGIVGDLRLRELRREIERDVAGQHAAGDEGVFAAIKFTADGLVIGVERPSDAARVETGFEF